MTKFNQRGEEVIRSLPGSDFGIDVIRGNIQGVSYIHKFGLNPDVDTAAIEDIWDVDGTKTWYDADQTLEIVSASTNDDGDPVGTGARTVTIVGLDDNGAEITQTATMNGTTAVALATDLMVVYRAWVLSAGTVATNDGLITIRLASAGATQAQIIAGNGQTLMAIYQVPASKKGYLYSMTGKLLGSTVADATINLMVRPSGGAWNVKEVMAIRTAGTSTFRDEYYLPIELDALSQVRMTAATSANNTIVGGSFDIVLVDD